MTAHLPETWTSPRLGKPAQPLPLRAEQVLQLLTVRYPAKEYAFMQQVANATGFGASRWADALVLSLWPSRGLELHGFEIKVSRTDWIRELRNPAKAEEIACYCDRWWIAVGQAGLVKPDELPPTWGLLEPTSKGDALRQVKEAPKNKKVENLDRAMIAAMLRRALENTVPKAVVVERETIARERGIELGKKEATGWDAASVKRELDSLKERVKEFEKRAGVDLSWDGEESAVAIRLARLLGRVGLDDSFSYAIVSLERLVMQMKKTAGEIKTKTTPDPSA